MRIALVVQGRFHAFDLANALTARGHTVGVFTNYPAWAVEKFGVPRAQVHSFVMHGVLTRAALKWRERIPSLYPETALHQLFGKWAANALRGQAWDIVHPWSGVAEESLRQRVPDAHYLLMRGSSHIRTQAELLAQEEQRVGAKQEQPGTWMIAREEREYALSDHIITLATFARRTFLEQGADPTRVWNVPLSAPVEQFRPAREIIAARFERIRAGHPLRILYVGALSYRKGMFDLAAVARALPRERFQFRAVGARPLETKTLFEGLDGRIDRVGKVPQAELPAHYAWADVFLFPTIEDGFPITLAQARVNGLPIISTVNSGAPDLIQEGETGWLVPIRSPQMLLDRLHQCDTDREGLAAMALRSYDEFRPRTWADVAQEFENVCLHVRGEAP